MSGRFPRPHGLPLFLPTIDCTFSWLKHKLIPEGGKRNLSVHKLLCSCSGFPGTGFLLHQPQVWSTWQVFAAFSLDSMDPSIRPDWPHLCDGSRMLQVMSPGSLQFHLQSIWGFVSRKSIGRKDLSNVLFPRTAWNKGPKIPGPLLWGSCGPAAVLGSQF